MSKQPYKPQPLPQKPSTPPKRYTPPAPQIPPPTREPQPSRPKREEGGDTPDRP